MKPDTLNLLCSPVSHEPIELVSEEGAGGITREVLVTIKSRERFPIYRGIPVFLSDNELTQRNKNKNFYNFIAPVYDLLHSLQGSARGGERKVREAFLKELEISDNDRVLEISVGTGANLRYLPPSARYYGLDISWKMLKQCRRVADRRHLDVELFLGDAEKLPFKNSVFDAVFNICSLRLFNDKARAIKEMARVAKPGRKIVIVDQRKAGVPEDLIPPGMQHVEVKEISWDLYCLTFKKPPYKLHPDMLT